MFRDNIAHNGYAATPDDLVYDTRDWQFDAGAPVRSTPLINKGRIYFGNTKGDFFAADKKTGQVQWQYHTGFAINSSPACQDGIIYFSDNEQTLYALKESNGELQWKFRMGAKLDYPWRFDYYYSSPVLFEDKLVVGSDDGNLYLLDRNDGKLVWKFKTKRLVRSTAAIVNKEVLFGDTEGIFYSLDIMTGKEKWAYTITGGSMDLEKFGFDRKAMLAAPVVSGEKIIFGARDVFLYCLDTSGRFIWKVDHVISWIISTVAIKDSFVVTSTSDGRFVQAVNLNTGKEIWKYHTPKATWSSPLINNDKVYEGCYDGQLFCLDLATGKRISQFATNGIIYSSPVISGSLLYMGSDDGNLYALKGHTPVKQVIPEKYVYYDVAKLNIYFRTGGDSRIREYLRGAGFTVIVTDTLEKIFADASSGGKTVVFATDYFSKKIVENNERSLLRKFLDGGGRIVLLGNNPPFFRMDESGSEVMGLASRKIDSVLGLVYGPTDTRAFGGFFTGFPTDKGKYFGLPPFWVSNFGIDKKRVDQVLGEDENGQASAFIKRYNNHGAFIQLWMDPELPVNLDAIIKVSEWDLD